MADLKHIGRTTSNQRRCVVAYRVVPGAPEFCLVVNTDSLDSDQHDSLMRLVESNMGQSAYELADAMSRQTLADGRNMLKTFHNQGKLVKMPSEKIEMTPNQMTTVNLAELNRLIAQQKGVTVADLAVTDGSATKKPAKQDVPVKSTDVASGYADESTAGIVEVDAEDGSEVILSDDHIATGLRSQADAMVLESKRLLDEAERLAPTKKAPAKRAPAKRAPAKRNTAAKKPAVKSTTGTKSV
jgi:DNA topoisomerase-1